MPLKAAFAGAGVALDFRLDTLQHQASSKRLQHSSFSVEHSVETPQGRAVQGSFCSCRALLALGGVDCSIRLLLLIVSTPVVANVLTHAGCYRAVLALGGVDCSIRLLLAGPRQAFKEVCCLTGHADWVRSLAFSHIQDSADTSQGQLHSQDATSCRLYCLSTLLS